MKNTKRLVSKVLIGGVLTGLALGSAGCNGNLKLGSEAYHNDYDKNKITPSNDTELRPIPLVRYEF